MTEPNDGLNSMSGKDHHHSRAKMLGAVMIQARTVPPRQCLVVFPVEHDIADLVVSKSS